MPNHKQLIRELSQHSQEAFSEIYDKYHKLVYYIIFSYTKDVEATKDLVQETFMKMWNNIHMYKFDTNFCAWLSTIAKNTTKDYLRTKKHIEIIDDEVVSNRHHMKSIIEFNVDARGTLSSLEYEVIVLTIIYNLKRREVADSLNKPIGTILRVYREAIKKLRYFYEVKDSNKKNKISKK